MNLTGYYPSCPLEPVTTWTSTGTSGKDGPSQANNYRCAANPCTWPCCPQRFVVTVPRDFFKGHEIAKGKA